MLYGPSVPSQCVTVTVPSPSPSSFLHAAYDYICETMDSSFAEPMRRDCTELTEAVIPSGHWMAQEQPIQVNAALAKWLAAKAPDAWPASSNDVIISFCHVFRDWKYHDLWPCETVIRFRVTTTSSYEPAPAALLLSSAGGTPIGVSRRRTKSRHALRASITAQTTT
jgi:hypothetical protein